MRSIWRYPVIFTAALLCLGAAACMATAQGIRAPSDSTVTDTSGTTPDESTKPKTTAEDRVFRHSFFFTWSVAEDKTEGEGVSSFIGGAYRFNMWPKQDLGFLFAFSGRLDETYTLEPIRPHFYLQREEKYRFLISLSVDKVLNIAGWFGAYGGVGAGYTWGEYEGTEVDPESKWTAVVDVGLTGRWASSSGGLIARLGYQYADRVTSGTDTIYFSLGIGI